MGVSATALELVMAAVRLGGSANVLFGVFVKARFASGRTKVIRLPLVLGLVRSRLGIKFHPAHWILYHFSPPFFLTSGPDIYYDTGSGLSVPHTVLRRIIQAGSFHNQLAPVHAHLASEFILTGFGGQELDRDRLPFRELRALAELTEHDHL